MNECPHPHNDALILVPPNLQVAKKKTAKKRRSFALSDDDDMDEDVSDFDDEDF